MVFKPLAPAIPMDIELDWTAAGLSPEPVRSTAQTLTPYLSQLRSVVSSRHWNHPAASLLLPDEKKFLAQSAALAQKWPAPALVVVVGIGGSNLGTLAVSQAVLGTQHNLLHPAGQLLFADTVDGPSVESIARIAVSHLSAGRHVVLNVVSKSGKTMETAANFETLLSKLSSGKGPRHLHVVVTTDENSALHKQAASRGFAVLPIPQMVGGRYSVFSNVGLFPLMLCGVNVTRLLSGAAAMRERCLSDAIDENPAALLASILALHRAKGLSIHGQFLFSNDLAGAGLWYRQLMGESIGKETDRGGQAVRTGITPTVSIGSTDLHSMAQLYLGGPRDKSFRFVTVGYVHPDPVVPASAHLESLAPHAGGRRLSQLMEAIVGGVQSAFRSKSIPYVHLRLPNLSEESIGALLQLEMVEMMLLAQLLNVNAFDQPAVEEYKTQTRKILQSMPAGAGSPEEHSAPKRKSAKLQSKSSHARSVRKTTSEGFIWRKKRKNGWTKARK